MKLKILTLLSLILFLGTSTQAQKVEEEDILGTWKLVIDVDEELDDEAEDADTILEEIIIKSVSGFVSGVLDNIDIYFDFQKRGKLAITVKAFGEVEEEEGEWYINRRGYLVIEDIDDDDDFHISSDKDEWRLEDGLLVNEDHERDGSVFLTRIN